MADQDSKDYSDVTLVCSVYGTGSWPLTELAGQVWAHGFHRTLGDQSISCCECRGEGEASALSPPLSPYIVSLKSWYVKASGDLIRLADHHVSLDCTEG